MNAPRQSAAILLFRRARELEVFLVHPGGPYFTRKDDGAWSLPKGEIESGCDPLATAIREFAEETGQTLDRCAPGQVPHALGYVQQRGGKRVCAWAVEGDWPPSAVLTSNLFELEWPPRSGKRQSFPEVDRCGFFPPGEARRKLNPAQAEFIDRLCAWLGEDARAPG
jgi:predicted NUDIX family NTP pyrophosphohydrolase